MNEKFNQVDSKELELPDTLFVRDIDSRVFQAIVTQCLTKIEGVAPLEGNLIDSFLGADRTKGIFIEQDQKNHAVNVKIELSVVYGVSIPEKAEEIQTKVAEEISRLTDLHVGTVHVVFKNLILPGKVELEPAMAHPSVQYTEEF